MRKSLFLLPLLSLSMAGLVACSSNDDVAGGPGSITTNGIALVDGKPASYATVALRRVDFRAEQPVEENALVVADSYADEKGNFKVEIPAEGKYRLTVLHDGVAYSKELSRDEFAVVGKSTSPDTVNLSATAVKTDAAGWFALSALPANDSLTLYFVSEDYAQDLGAQSVYVTPHESLMKDYRSEVKVPVDTSSKDTVQNDTAETLPQVLALLSDGTPAAYATVALRAADAMVDNYVVQNAMAESDLRTDKQGRFDMEWPAKGDFRLTVVKDGFAFSKVYSAKELAGLDTVRLSATASISSKVTLRSVDTAVWVGVYGLDLLVKTNNVGAYVLPNVPANDELGIYFVTADSANDLYAEWKTIADPYSTEFLSPVKILQDFENGGEGWYQNTDSLKKGTEFSPLLVKDGIVYDSTRKSKVFHGEYTLAKDDYAWVLVGTSFEHYMNLAAIDSIVFYAKGDGNIRLSLENYIDPNKNLKAATDWIPLSKTWSRISVNPAELCVGTATEESCFTTWSTIKGYVKQFHIFVQDGTEFYIDDVTLYGALF